MEIIKSVTDLEAMRNLSIEGLLLPILIQLIIIIVCARVFAGLFRKIGQPQVVGEIFAGVILGPSLFGMLFPSLFQSIFHPILPNIAAGWSQELLRRIFDVLAQIGLIFLLFLIGLEFDFTKLKQDGRSALSISLCGILVPFISGVALGYLIFPMVNSEANPIKNQLGFSLFLGVALSITAIPILGRIMMELNITRTRIGVITITSAAIDDAAGWILLATVGVAVKTGFDWVMTGWMLMLTILFGAMMIFVVRPFLVRYLTSALAKNAGNINMVTLTVIIVLLLLSAIATNLIGIFAIFGAFIFGAILSDQKEFRTAIRKQLQDMVTVFFLPIFFTNTGLRTEIGSLESTLLWGIALLIIAVSFLGKFGGCSIAAYWSGFSRKESMIIGVMMNTRALMELIVINVGYDLGVIPKSIFCMLVIMALLSTIVTGPLVHFLKKGTELEPFINNNPNSSSNSLPELEQNSSEPILSNK